MIVVVDNPATAEVYTLSLHDALPILVKRPHSETVARAEQLSSCSVPDGEGELGMDIRERCRDGADRKSTRLNSSHGYISYAVFCLKKKKELNTNDLRDDLELM